MMVKYSSSLRDIFIFALIRLCTLTDDDDDDSGDEQPRRTSRKLQRKDFLQRMHTKNGNASLFN